MDEIVLTLLGALAGAGIAAGVVGGVLAKELGKSRLLLAEEKTKIQEAEAVNTELRRQLTGEIENIARLLAGQKDEE